MLTVSDVQIDIHISDISEEDVAELLEDIRSILKSKSENISIQVTGTEGTYYEW